VLYHSGKGNVAQNLVLAYMWLSLAGDAGYEHSKKLLPAVAQKMAPKQIDEAKQEAQQWTKAHGS
jgi:hypothetical protein